MTIERRTPGLTTGLALAVAFVALAVASVPQIPGWAPATILLVLAVALRPPRFLRHPRPRLGFVALVGAPPLFASGFGIAVHVGLPAGAAAATVAALGLVGVLLAPPSAARDSVLVRVAVLVLTVAVVFAPPGAAVVCCVLFVAALVPALLSTPFDASARGTSDDSLVRRVVGAAEPSAAKGKGRFALILLAVALLYGGALHTALPSEGLRRTNDREGAGFLPSLDLFPDDARDGPAGSVPRTGGFAGPRSTHEAFLRSSERVELEVRIDQGVPGPSPLYFRGMVYDTFDGIGWERSRAASAHELAAPDANGWCSLSSLSPRRPRWDLTFRDRTGRGARTALWLLPGTDLVDLGLVGKQEGLHVGQDGAVFMATPSVWRAGNRYRTRGPALGHDRAAARGRRSTPGIAPLNTYADAPPEAQLYLGLAASVLDGAVEAAARAEQLEAWLTSPAFAYRLSEERAARRLDRARPVADFASTVRQGNCWCFASTMTVMMRALGHPARLAVGYRPGPKSYLENARIWSLRGADAHAWCEVFYEGVGWVIYDPTPAAASTSDAIERDADSASTSWLDGLQIGGWQDVLLRWVAPALVLILLLVAMRGRRATHVSDDGAAAPTAALSGVGAMYARALVLLARLGVVRRRPETPREFLARAVPTLPPAEPQLNVLTAVHGAARYGGESATARTIDDARGALTWLEAAVVAARKERRAAKVRAKQLRAAGVPGSRGAPGVK